LTDGGQKVENVVWNAVRSSADGKADDVFAGEGFGVNATEGVEGSVSVGEGLKIGKKLFGFISGPHEFGASAGLFGDGGALSSGVGAEPLIVAVYAAAFAHRAVSVRACEPGVYGYLIDFAAEPAFQVVAECIVAFISHKFPPLPAKSRIV